MQEVISNIINLDKETAKMKQRYEDLIKKKENEIRKALLDLEKSYGKESYLHENSNTLVDKKAVLERIESIYTENMDRLKKTYEDIKDKVVADIWNDLFIRKEGI